MKKIFGISLAAILAPMLANAAAGDPVPGDPGNTVSKDTLTAAPYNMTEQQAEARLAEITGPEPKYALKPDNIETDGNIANARYVKGAYNALIRGINAEQDAIDHMTDDLAKKTGVEKTLKNATVSGGTVSADSSVTNTNVTLTDGFLTAAGTVTFGVTVMDNWDSDLAASSNLSTTGNFSKTLQHDALIAAAPTSNSITVSGGTVSWNSVDSTSVSYSRAN